MYIVIFPSNPKHKAMFGHIKHSIRKKSTAMCLRYSTQRNEKEIFKNDTSFTIDDFEAIYIYICIITRWRGEELVRVFKKKKKHRYTDGRENCAARPELTSALARRRHTPTHIHAHVSRCRARRPSPPLPLGPTATDARVTAPVVGTRARPSAFRVRGLSIDFRADPAGLDDAAATATT